MSSTLRRYLIPFGIGAVLAFGVSGLRSITRAQTTAEAPAAAPAAAAPAAAPVAPAPDPEGSATGSAADVTVKAAGQPTPQELLDAIGHSKIAINIVWTLLTGFLVMFMQAGFAMVETGFTRAKNAAHTFSMNFMVYPIGMLGYWICGFALQMGGVGAVAALGGTPGLTHEWAPTLFGHPFGLLGTGGFFLGADVYDVGVFTLFLFQMVFMDTAVTIPTGAMAERWKWSAFLVYGFFMSMFVYPIFGNWVWGGGWLSQLGVNFGLGHGHVDFAGSSVVHMVGGVAALAGALVLGPRIGKYTKDGKPVAIPGHHIPMAVVGTFILAFGWFGFNPGSTLSGNDLRIGVVATNTMLASAGGAMTSMLYMMFRYGKPDPSMMCNGFLAGLVAITAPCAFVNSMSSVIIGAISGVLVCWAVFFIERIGIDDPVGAISVHGVNGAFGVLSIGIFADGKYGDGWNGVPGKVIASGSQLAAQSIGVVTCFLFVFVSFYVFFKVQDAIMGIRVPAEVEIAGLDLPEMGALAYPEFQITGGSSFVESSASGPTPLTVGAVAKAEANY
jgi:Amt family ammonium transporter